MQENNILHESPHFWVCKRGSKFEINLHLIGGSVCVGEKSSLEAAKTFVNRAEKYPKNLKYNVPPELQYQVESFQRAHKTV